MRLCSQGWLRRIPCPERQGFEGQLPAFAGKYKSNEVGAREGGDLYFEARGFSPVSSLE